MLPRAACVKVVVSVTASKAVQIIKIINVDAASVTAIARELKHWLRFRIVITDEIPFSTVLRVFEDPRPGRFALLTQSDVLHVRREYATANHPGCETNYRGYESFRRIASCPICKVYKRSSTSRDRFVTASREREPRGFIPGAALITI